MAKTPFGKFLSDVLANTGWPDVEYDEEIGTLSTGGHTIIERDNGQVTLHFFTRAYESGVIKEVKGIKKLSVPETVDLYDLLYVNERRGRYYLSRESQIRMMLDPLEKGFSSLKVAKGGKNIRLVHSVLSLPESKVQQILKEAEAVWREAEKQRSRFERFLAERRAVTYGRPVKKDTTSLGKGELSLTVDRLNLRTKQSKADFDKYLDDDDLRRTEQLADKMVRCEAFSKKFLSRLSDYFVKERLSDIIAKGRRILALRSSSLDTLAAQTAMEDLGYKGVKQLETLWQRYFEDYLLYLIFSYRAIFPKVELEDVQDDKKAPDFLGINHYNGVDVIEIKTHLKNVLSWDKSHSNYFFSSEMSRAIIQTSNYMDAILQHRFVEAKDRKAITEYVGEENVFQPRGVIIISSVESLTNRGPKGETLQRDFTKLRSSINNIQVLTFDEVLSMGEAYVDHFVLS